MKINLAYSRPACATGLALRQEMQRDRFFNRVYRVRENTRSLYRADAFLRYGNTSIECPRGSVEINRLSNVRDCVNKLTMLNKLSTIEGVRLPKFSPIVHGLDLEEYMNDRGFFYVRGSNNTVRYDDTLRRGDLYVTRPVKRSREYRVHVFNGNILGIYEKIPHDPRNTTIFKAANCRFVRCDLERSRCNDEAQEMCINAVRGMGLDFGAIDLIRAVNGNFFMTEVNTAPSLNSQNIPRFLQEIKALLMERL